MVTHSDKPTVHELNKLSPGDAHALNSRAFAFGKTRSGDNLIGDDLIVTLANAYENQRARQVSEWERRQRVAATF